MTDQSGGTILVVDDDPVVLGFVRRTLAEDDLQVLLSDNSVDALDKAATEKVDLLLTDVMMPEMNGIELARIMHQRYPDMRIIFMTGYMCPQLSSDSFHDKAPCLKKPFTPRELRSVLQVYLRNKNPFAIDPPGADPDGY